MGKKEVLATKTLEEDMRQLTERDLKGMVAFLNPNGALAAEVAAAKKELDHRGVDYSDCIEPRSAA